MLDDTNAEPALHRARAGVEDLHRLFEPTLRTGWADDGEVSGPPPELPVQHEERQTAEVVAVQVAHGHGIDSVRVDLLLRSAVRLVAPQSSSTAGGEAGPGARALQVWNRPPEPNASPLPATVTRISRSSCPASVPSRYRLVDQRQRRPLICGPC